MSRIAASSPSKFRIALCSVFVWQARITARWNMAFAPITRGAVADVPAQELVRALDPGVVLLRGGVSGHDRDRALEDAPPAQDVDRVLGLDGDVVGDGVHRHDVGGHEDAAALPRPDAQEAAALEHAQRLAQRRLGDPELAGELLLRRQAVVQVQPRALDPLEEVLDRRLERPGRPARARRTRPSDTTDYVTATGALPARFATRR